MVFGNIPASMNIAGLEDVIMDVAGGSLGQRLSSRLTGTVAKTAASTALTGSSTLFTTELAVGDAIKVGIEVFTVSSISSATSLVLDSAAVYSESTKFAYKDFDLWGAASGDGTQRVSVNSAGALVLAAPSGVAILRSGTTAALVRQCPAPAAATASATLTAAQVLTGMVAGDPAANVTWTLPTAALMVAAVPGAAVGDMIQFSVINEATIDIDETVTINAGSGGTLVGFGDVQARQTTTATAASGGSGLFAIRFTNVTLASEAYVCYRLS
jgi:hypothetical protein